MLNDIYRSELSELGQNHGIRVIFRDLGEGEDDFTEITFLADDARWTVDVREFPVGLPIALLEVREFDIPQRQYQTFYLSAHPILLMAFFCYGDED